MVLYQIYLTSNSQLVDLQLTGGRYNIKVLGINYQAGNVDVFTVQFQSPLLQIKGSRLNNGFNATPIGYLTYQVPTTNTQLSHPMSFVCDYFGSFVMNIIDMSTNVLVQSGDGNRFKSCILNLDIEPWTPNKEHLV